MLLLLIGMFAGALLSMGLLFLHNLPELLIECKLSKALILAAPAGPDAFRRRRRYVGGGGAGFGACVADSSAGEVPRSLPGLPGALNGGWDGGLSAVQWATVSWVSVQRLPEVSGSLRHHFHVMSRRPLRAAQAHLLKETQPRIPWRHQKRGTLGDCYSGIS